MTTYLIPILLTLYIALAIISAIGKDFFINLAWSLYILLPSDLRTLSTQQKALQKDILKTSAELRSTSSQDEFAKWARLNRQHDKQLQQLQTLNSKIEGHKAKFRRVTGIGFWIGTTGTKGVVQWWFSKQPVFWLPVGAFPGWVEYVVSFPKAPRGSVSTMVFGLCATRVITFVIGIGKDIAVGRKQNLDKVGTTKDPGFSGPRFEDVTEEEKKKE